VAESEDDHDIDYTDPEQAAQSKIAGLANVKVTTGTEGEACIYRQRAKLFRFRDN